MSLTGGLNGRLLRAVGLPHVTWRHIFRMPRRVRRSKIHDRRRGSAICILNPAAVRLLSNTFQSGPTVDRGEQRFSCLWSRRRPHALLLLHFKNFFLHQRKEGSRHSCEGFFICRATDKPVYGAIGLRFPAFLFVLIIGRQPVIDRVDDVCPSSEFFGELRPYRNRGSGSVSV